MRIDSETYLKKLSKFHEKFSVILPVYKRNSYTEFKKSILSIVYQNVLPSEIIIIYDGPVSPRIKNFVEQLKKKLPIFISILINSTNVGLGKSLAKAVRLAKFNIVARMDADDVCNKLRFYYQFKIMKKDKPDVLGSNLLEYYKKDIKIKFNPLSNLRIRKYLFFRNPFNHPTVMFKKNSVIKAGNYQNVSYYEDYYLWIRMSFFNFKFMNLKKILCTSTINNNFISRRSGFKYYKNYLFFLYKCKKINFYNFASILFLAFIRTVVFLLPKSFLNFLYSNFLRSNIK
jgi:hypothetical protein